MSAPEIEWPDTGLDLSRLTDLQRRIWEAGYFRGCVHGIDRGRQIAADDMAAVWAETARQVRAVANRPTFLELSQRRGEPANVARGLEQQCHLGFEVAS